MIPKVTEAKYMGSYKILLRFSDGVEGEIDLEKELWGEVFEPLKEMDAFSNFAVDPELNTIVWPNGADFAPEFLYHILCPNYELKQTPTSGAA